MSDTQKLVVIPAPIHSDSIPRMVLRRLAGKPLLAHMIRIASTNVHSNADILVLTDDDEVALLAERMGCSVRVDSSNGKERREFQWRQIYDAILNNEQENAKSFETVTLLPPSSPLLQGGDFARSEKILAQNHVDSVIAQRSRKHDRHFEPDASGNGYSLNAIKQKIRTFATSRRRAISPTSFWGRRVEYSHIPDKRAIEIRSSHDWWICEKLLAQKRIVFVVIGYPTVGLGHVYRTLSLAHELIDHEVLFVCTRESQLALEQIGVNKFSVHQQGEEDLAATVLALEPDLIVNDILHTQRDYMEKLKQAGVKVVNFEDLGPGTAVADLVINAIYEEKDAPPTWLNGPNYFCIRDEFMEATPKQFSETVNEVIITFGGTDALDVTYRLARLILPVARKRGIHISIITGPGYLHLEHLQHFLAEVPADCVELANGTKRMSEYMARADVAFSSAGRTVFELAAMRLPGIIIASHEREETHTFASEKNGMRYLGRNDMISDADILAAFKDLLDSPEKRRVMRDRTGQWDFRFGKQRVLKAMKLLLTYDNEE